MCVTFHRYARCLQRVRELAETYSELVGAKFRGFDPYNVKMQLPVPSAFLAAHGVSVQIIKQVPGEIVVTGPQLIHRVTSETGHLKMAWYGA